MKLKKSFGLTIFILLYVQEYCQAIIFKDYDSAEPETIIKEAKSFTKRRSLPYDSDSSNVINKFLRKRSAVFQIQVAKTTSGPSTEKTGKDEKNGPEGGNFELPVALQVDKEEAHDLQTAEDNTVLIGSGATPPRYYERLFPHRFHPNRHLYPSYYPRPGSYYTYIDHGYRDQYGRYRGSSSIEKNWNSGQFDFPFSADYSNLTSLEEIAAKIVYRPTVKPFQVKMNDKNETGN